MTENRVKGVMAVGAVSSSQALGAGVEVEVSRGVHVDSVLLHGGSGGSCRWLYRFNSMDSDSVTQSLHRGGFF